MRPGGFTIRGRDDAVSAKRDDHTLWLHEFLTAVGGPERGDAATLLALDGVLAQFGEAVVDQLSELGRTEPMGCAADGVTPLYYTGRTDMMVACYPGGGAAYGPHIDNLDGDGREALDYGRCFTMVYYLNGESWDASKKGGGLRVYVPPSGGEGREAERARHGPLGGEAIEVPPVGDYLVIFRADKLLHEVRPSMAPRYAATVWLYGGTKAQRERERAAAPPQARS